MSPGDSESLCQTRGGKGPWPQAPAGQEESWGGTNSGARLGARFSAAVLMRLD